jgi:multiple sugar transport system substrate-binding protein
MTGITRRGVFKRASQVAATSGAVAALASAATAVPAVAAPASLTGKLQVVLNLDFNKNYNTFLKDTITKYAADKKWDLDLSDLAGFLGSSDIYQKLQAQKQAGQPVDLIIHTLSGLLMQTYDLTRDVAPLVNSQVAKYGQVYPSARAGLNLGGKWMALPFHDRVGGYFVRRDKFEAAGKSVANGDFDTWEGVKASCLAATAADQSFYGWGMTANRSGDGESLVWAIVQEWGGALADPTGQLVTLYSPETIDGMTWLADIYQNPANAGMLPPGIGSWSDPDNNQAWLAGTIGFTSNAGTLYAQSVVDNTTLTDGTVLKDVTDYALIPMGPYGVRLQGSGGTHFFFMNGSKNFDEASTLAQDLINPELQRSLWKIGEGYTVPAYANFWTDPTVTVNPISLAFKAVSQNEPPFTGVAYRGPISAAADGVSQQNVITDMFGAILGGKPVDQAVREAHQQSVDIFKQFGLKGA